MTSGRIAVLLCCHNRRRTTLACLDNIFGQKLPPGTSVDIFLVDDGSTDGTAEAIRAKYPQVHVLRGDGNLYWGGGMRVAFAAAAAEDYDYYLWLNDDTVMDADALRTMLLTHEKIAEQGRPDSIVVGSIRDVRTGGLTYGGVVRGERWRALRFERLEPTDEPRECETMNGNCVLIPRSVARMVGAPDAAFTHGMGDFDYGLRARKAGCSVYIAPDYVGYCSRNHVRGTWQDATLPFGVRLKKAVSPKGLPPLQWAVFARRHAGSLWFVYWLQPYLRLLLSSSLTIRTRRSLGREEAIADRSDAAVSVRDEANARRPKVAVVYKTLPQYRRRFFELLNEKLARSDIEFLLIYGQPGAADAAKGDTVELPWARKIENKIWKVGSRELYWQPCMDLLKDVDLVIVEQANKLLLNYVLLVRQLVGRGKVAFWGHGKNFQARGGNRASETTKRFVSRRPHWWFAYNELSAGVVKHLGFPAERITSVQNAIDTRSLMDARKSVSEKKVERVREELDLKGNNVCLYAGGMYPDKRLAFLLEACVLVREKVPDFEMIFIGAGTDRGLVEAAAREYEWIKYVGPKFDEEKVPYFELAKLFLMPGLVGLAVLDSFALQVPLVTTAITYHSPEIEYLQSGQNGIILGETEKPEEYAAVVSQLLDDDEARAKLVAGCKSASSRYTVEEMADRFATGVRKALEHR